MSRSQTSDRSSPIRIPRDAGLAKLRLEQAISLLSRAGTMEIDGSIMPDVALVQQIIDGLCELSSLDALTGLSNVRQFRVALDQELDRVSRGGTPMALFMIDADRFKSVNDTYGHVAGDVVLKAVANALRENLRPMDTLARYGGEEFAAILPNCIAQHAFRAAERFREYIEAHAIRLPDGETVRITVSVGVVCVSMWTKIDADAAIAAADRRLYMAKSQGRNKVVMDAELGTGVSASERAALLSLNMQVNDE